MGVTAAGVMAGAAVASAGVAAKGAYDQKKAGEAALDMQEGQNAKTEAMLKEQYGDAKQAALKYIPQGAAAAQAAYEKAYETARAAGQQRSGMFTDGNVQAQETLLAGLPMMNDALLGKPVDMSQLQASSAGSNTNGIYDTMKLDGSGGLSAGLAGLAAEDLAAITPEYDITPNTTTNRQVVGQALQNGYISKDQYNWFQDLFQESGDLGSQYGWGAGDHQALLNTLEHGDLTGRNRQTMEALFASLPQASQGA